MVFNKWVQRLSKITVCGINVRIHDGAVDPSVSGGLCNTDCKHRNSILVQPHGIPMPNASYEILPPYPTAKGHSVLQTDYIGYPVTFIYYRYVCYRVYLNHASSCFSGVVFGWEILL